MPDNSGIDAYFGKLIPELRPLADALRDRIDFAGPSLSQSLAWGFPCWSGRERLFSVIAHKSHLNLQLWNGARLWPDFPDRIEGRGKMLRHVKLRRMDDLNEELDAIITAAIQLDLTDPQKVR